MKRSAKGENDGSNFALRNVVLYTILRHVEALVTECAPSYD